MTLNDRIDELLAIHDGVLDDDGVVLMKRELAAFCAVAKADDPEPERYPYDDDRAVQLGISRKEWASWRKREDARVALYDALGKE